jgi:hypothetical protein
MGRKNWIRIRDEQPGSYFRELRNQFFGLKYLNYLMRIRDLGWKKIRIRDGKLSDSGLRFGIRDKHPGSATMVVIK